jgi:signal transduction histidine kinase
VVLVDSTSFALFGLCPQAYMTMAMAPATGFVTLMSLTPAAAFLARTGDVTHTVAVMLPFGLVIIAFSTVTAVTIIRIERRSEERAALIKELASTRAEIARLSHETGIAAERQRLAGEIHDTVAQGLSSVVMLVQAADAELTRNPEEARRHLTMAARTARENLDEARAMVGALTPAALSDASLTDALRRLSDRFTAEHGVGVEFTVTGEARQLPTGAEVVLLRVAQESLTNVRKHARASAVSLRLAFVATSVVLEVADDGCGFVLDALPTGYGLGAMRNRVEQIGGALTVHSAPAGGTTVRTEVMT